MKQKTSIGILLVLLLVINLGPASSLAADTEGDTAKDNEFKVIGYYSGSLFNEPIEKLQTDKLTHIRRSEGFHRPWRLVLSGETSRHDIRVGGCIG